MADKLTPRSQDFSEWYNQIVQRAELADYGPSKGSMIIRPYGYALWENIQAYLDARFKNKGVKNAYFPLFIPKSFLAKEAEHVEGFAPQLAVVTIGGGETLEEELIVRPTSETIINDSVKKWIQSYRDLPLLLNCWNNVVRWELRTKLFIRTSEFLWQEGHTSHATFAQADAFAREMLEVYRDFAENAAAVPVIAGKKSESEKFAGAHTTYTLEPMMGDKRALQFCTSHNLGDNFARGFGIQYLDQSNALQFVWQTSWGLSTRVVGGIIMVHGDDKGLILPPRLAPTQIVIVPIFKTDAERANVLEVATKVRAALANYRVEIDAREGVTPGFKFNEWEARGVPLRIEIGPKDLEKNQVVFARRDTGAKEFIAQAAAVTRAGEWLDAIQRDLFARAQKFRDENTFRVDTWADFTARTVGEGGAGFLLAHWCGKTSCEKEIQAETKATLRVIPFDQVQESGACIKCGEASNGRVIFGKAY
ncbi:MAG: proline--tRNA ligase [Chloroflexi bacterium]|nr:proline--tRNA ligase [Chloroflexota bacterium]